MRICVVSDWHIGLTKEKTIRRLLKQMINESIDLIINLGDNCGGLDGARSVKTVMTLTREYFPTLPIIACLGNHDYWCYSGKKTNPSPERFAENLDSIRNTFKVLGVHFLDDDGAYRAENKITIVGHSLWYAENPSTNDLNWMPVALEGDTHRYMRIKAYQKLFEHLDSLTDEDSTRIFCSHFPVVEFKNRLDIQYGGSKSLGDTLIELFKITRFLNGHAHQRHEGPLRYESGSDYGKPRYLMLDI